MTREELLAQLLVERYTPIPPHRVLLSLDQIEEKRIQDERDGAEHHDPVARKRPWTFDEVQRITAKRGRNYASTAEECAVLLARSVGAVRAKRNELTERRQTA